MRSIEEPYEAVSIRRRTSTIVELWLSPRGDPLSYRPGQYILLADAEHRVPPRPFSVANAPRADGLISLLVTRVAEGETSGWVHELLSVGDAVSVSGPFGTFVDDRAATAPALFLAAGSGLAPIRALLDEALLAGVRTSLTLIVSGRSEPDVIDRERFVAWQSAHPGFRFFTALTHGAGLGPHGRIQALLPILYPDLSNHDVFIAGAPAFVQSCAVVAGELGAPAPRIRSEPFLVEQRQPSTPAQVG